MINRLPLIALLACTQLLLAQPEIPECCFDATCVYCIDIEVCNTLPFGGPEDSNVGGAGNCGVDHPTTICSSWMENNTLGLTECISPCGDPAACNYDPVYGPEAPDYAQNCTYGCGCTDFNACNFNPEAEIDDGSCFFGVPTPSIAVPAGDFLVYDSSCDTSGYQSSLLAWTDSLEQSVLLSGCDTLTVEIELLQNPTCAQGFPETTALITGMTPDGNTYAETRTFYWHDDAAPEIHITEDTILVPCDVYDPGEWYGGALVNECLEYVLTWAEEYISDDLGTPIQVNRYVGAVDDCGYGIYNTGWSQWASEPGYTSVEDSSLLQVIILTDTVSPSVEILCPQDATWETPYDCLADTTWAANGIAVSYAWDNCDPDVQVSNSYYDEIEDTCPGSYTVYRTWSALAEDHWGNTTISTCLQTIWVNDVTPPSIDTEAVDMTVECDGMGNVMDYLTWQSTQGGAMASDDCSAVTWSHEVLEAGDDCDGSVGYAIVEFIATDDCGNSSSTMAMFTIEDTTDPSITAALEVAVPCDEYNADTPYGDYTVIDDCYNNSVSTLIEDSYLDSECEGTIERTYTAEDACGNTSQFTQIIHLYISVDCSDPGACNYEEGSEGNSDCDYSCFGCTDPFACNYAPQATTPDFSCEYNSCAGCTDPGACNFDAGATINNGGCFYYGPILDCDGQCINDTDGDGVCDENEILGCQDPEACNYEMLATDPDECTYPASAYTLCDGTCINDSDGDEVCDEEEVVGCQDPSACDFDMLATDSGACSYPAEAYLDCEGDCLNDADGDGICDELEIPGCPDPSACNFESEATDDDGSCVPSGCMDPDACNYLAAAGCDDGNCDYSCCPGPGCCSDGTVWDSDILGCITDYSAPAATCGDGTVWDPINQECIIAIPGDLNFDGCISVSDLLQLLTVHGTCPPIPEWPDSLNTNGTACSDTLAYWTSAFNALTALSDSVSEQNEALVNTLNDSITTLQEQYLTALTAGDYCHVQACDCGGCHNTLTFELEDYECDLVVIQRSVNCNQEINLQLPENAIEGTSIKLILRGAGYGNFQEVRVQSMINGSWTTLIYWWENYLNFEYQMATKTASGWVLTDDVTIIPHY